VRPAEWSAASTTWWAAISVIRGVNGKDARGRTVTRSPAQSVVSAPLDAFRAGEDLVRDTAQVVLHQLIEVDAAR
jgi:hypothetical protein